MKDDEELRLGSSNIQCYVVGNGPHHCPFCDGDRWTTYFYLVKYYSTENLIWECDECGATFSSFSFEYAED